MFRPKETLTAIEQQSLEQATRLYETVVTSCIIVFAVVFSVAILFLSISELWLSAAWVVAASLMIFATFAYARFSAPTGITETNFKDYLRGHVWISGMTGLVWSGFAILALNTSSSFNMLISFTIVTSITLGGMLPNSAYRATYIALLICCVLPLTLYWFIAVPVPFKFFANALLAYFIFGLISSARTEIAMRDLLISRQAEKLNEKLKTENAFMELANKEKSKFMVATVHDFSQPLHAQGFFIQALRKTLTMDKQRELLDRVESSWRSQSELLQGIGDIARFDSGLIVANVVPVSLELLLEDIGSEFQHLAQHKEILFETELIPVFIKSDPTLLARIVRNLVSNAFKFTPDKGTIRLMCYEYKHCIRIEVNDTGPGIESMNHENIFEEYVQLDNNAQGLGLGLSIVKRLVSTLNVKLEIQSKLGKGSSFILNLPDRPNYTPIANKATKQISIESKPLIFIVDNEKDIRDGMQSLLESEGCEVVMAANSHEAIETICALSRLPSLLVVDNRLSESDIGKDLIRRLRDEVNEMIPAILMTGDVDSLVGVNLGQDVTLLAKPVEPAGLLRIVEALGR